MTAQRVNNQALDKPLGTNEESFEALLNREIKPAQLRRPTPPIFRKLLKLYRNMVETHKAQDYQAACLQDTVRQLQAEIKIRTAKETLFSRRIAELEHALEDANVEVPQDKHFMVVGGNRVRIT